MYGWKLVRMRPSLVFVGLTFTAARNFPLLATRRATAVPHDTMKQAVERLDNVRQHAGEQLLRVLALPRPHVAAAEQWAVCGEARMRQLLLR